MPRKLNPQKTACFKEPELLSFWLAEVANIKKLVIAIFLYFLHKSRRNAKEIYEPDRSPR